MHLDSPKKPVLQLDYRLFGSHADAKDDLRSNIEYTAKVDNRPIAKPMRP